MSETNENRCPWRLLSRTAHGADRGLKLINIGDEIEVLSSDKGSAKDIPEWVNKVHHEMVGITQQDGYWSIVVRKAK